MAIIATTRTVQSAGAPADAKSLLLDLIGAIPNGEKAAALFADDGVLELPFLHALGRPTRFQGRAQIRDLYNFVAQLYPDFSFKRQDTKVLIETPDQVFAEFMAHATAQGTERRVHLLFAGRLVAKKGKIKLLREFVNVVSMAQALNPNGAAGLPPPDNEIFSVPPDYVS